MSELKTYSVFVSYDIFTGPFDSPDNDNRGNFDVPLDLSKPVTEQVQSYLIKTKNINIFNVHVYTVAEPIQYVKFER